MANTVSVDIIANTRKFKRSMASLGDATGITKMRSNLSRGFGAIKTGLLKVGKWAGGAAVAAIGTVAGVAITKGFTRAIQLQEAQAKLEGLGHSGKTTAKIMDNALAAVKGTAFGMGDAAGVAASIVAAGVKPGKELEGTLKLVADAATIAGTDMSSMGAIFGKVAASNKVQMDVINQLHDQGIPALSLLADEMGVTQEQASKMASAGEIDFATFQAAMENGLGGAAQKSGKTFKGSMANMGAALGRLGAMFAGPIVESAPGLFQAIAGAIDTAATVLQPFAEKFGKWLGPIMEQAAEWVSKIDFSKIFSGIDTGGLSDLLALFSPLGEVVKALLPGLMDAVKALLPSLTELGGVVKKVAGAIGKTLAKILPVLAEVLLQVVEALMPVVEVLAGALSDVLPIIADAFMAVVDALTPVIKILAGVLADVLPIIAKAFGNIVQALAPLLPVLINALAPVLPIIATLIGKVVKALAPFIAALGEYLADALAIIIPVIAELAKAILPILATILDTIFEALKPILPSFTDLIKAISPLLPIFGMLIKAILPIFVTLIKALAPIIKVLATIIVNVLSGAFKILIPVITWLIKKVITPLAQWLAKKLPKFIAVLKVVWTKVWGTIKNVLGKVWDWLKKNVFNKIKTTLVVMREGFRIMRDKVKAIWKRFRDILKAGWDWVKKNVFSKIKDGLSGVRDRFASIRDKIKAIWKNLREKLRDGWTWIKDKVFSKIKDGVSAVKDRFSSVRDRIKNIWGNLKSALRAGWVWIKDNVFSKFKDGLTSIKDAFKSVKNRIKEIWNKLKGIAARPINFVIEDVYNNGIRKWWNNVADAVGLKDSIGLDRADKVEGFANGGVRENHTAQIAPAGAWRVWAEDETGGEAYIPLAASKRGRSMSILSEVAQRFGYGLTQFKNGGWWGDRWNDVKGSFKKGWGNIKGVAGNLWNAGKMAGKIFTDPIGAITKALSHVIGNKGTGGNVGDLFKMVGTLPGEFAKGLGEKVKSLFDAGEGKSDTSGGGGTGGSELSGKLASMERLAKAMDSSVRVTSGRRPGATTVTGYVSYHARGRALDMVSNNMGALWDKLYTRYGKTSPELFYSGRSFSRFGVKGTPRMDHWDHVHWAMAQGGILGGRMKKLLFDSGGYLPTGTSIVQNNTGRPEPLRRVDKEKGNVTINLTVHAPVGSSSADIGREVYGHLSKYIKQSGRKIA